MASQFEEDATSRARTIAHMNKGHQDSLSRYLQHYHSFSFFGARSACLADIDFDSMTLHSSPNGNETYEIPFSPPMTSWSEVRPRVVEMDSKATTALGRSAVTVKRYTPPRGFLAVVWIACFVTFITFPRRANFEPGGWCYDGLLKHVPNFSSFCWRIQPLVISTMVLVHTTEMVHMERSRLRRHNVRAFGSVWWLWILSTFVEGFGAFLRFDEIVREEEERRAKVGH